MSILSHEELKKLYIQKMLAISQKDFAFLDQLKKQHTELFDKKFLYRMLQKELEITGSELPQQITNILLAAIQQVKH